MFCQLVMFAGVLDVVTVILFVALLGPTTLSITRSTHYNRFVLSLCWCIMLDNAVSVDTHCICSRLRHVLVLMIDLFMNVCAYRWHAVVAGLFGMVVFTMLAVCCPHRSSQFVFMASRHCWFVSLRPTGLGFC